MIRKFAGRTARDLARSIENAVHSGDAAAGRAASSHPAACRVVPAQPGHRGRRLSPAARPGNRRGRWPPRHPRPVEPGESRSFPADQRPAPEGLFDLATGNPDPELLPALAPVLGRMSVSATPLRRRGRCNARLASFAAGEFAADGVSADHTAVVSGGSRRHRASAARTPAAWRSDCG